MAKYRIETDSGTYEVEVDDEKSTEDQSPVNVVDPKGGLAAWMGADSSFSHNRDVADRVGTGIVNAGMGFLSGGGPVGAAVGGAMGAALPNKDAGGYASDIAAWLTGLKGSQLLSKVPSGAGKVAAGMGLGWGALKAGQGAGELTRSVLEQRRPKMEALAPDLVADPLAAVAGGIGAHLGPAAASRNKTVRQNKFAEELAGRPSPSRPGAGLEIQKATQGARNKILKTAAKEKDLTLTADAMKEELNDLILKRADLNKKIAETKSIPQKALLVQERDAIAEAIDETAVQRAALKTRGAEIALEGAEAKSNFGAEKELAQLAKPREEKLIKDLGNQINEAKTASDALLEEMVQKKAQLRGLQELPESNPFRANFEPKLVEEISQMEGQIGNYAANIRDLTARQAGAQNTIDLSGAKAGVRTSTAVQESRLEGLVNKIDIAENAEELSKQKGALNSVRRTINGVEAGGKDSRAALQILQAENAMRQKEVQFALKDTQNQLQKMEFVDPSLRRFYAVADDPAQFLQEMRKATPTEVSAAIKAIRSPQAKESLKGALVDDFFQQAFDRKTGKMSKLEQLWFPSEQNPSGFQGKFAAMYGDDAAQKAERLLEKFATTQSANLWDQARDVLNHKLQFLVAAGPFGILFGGPSLLKIGAMATPVVATMAWDKFFAGVLKDPARYDTVLKLMNNQIPATAIGTTVKSLTPWLQDNAIKVGADQVESLSQAAMEGAPDQTEEAEEPPQMPPGNPPMGALPEEGIDPGIPQGPM
jgi:hypothetical protein